MKIIRVIPFIALSLALSACAAPTPVVVTPDTAQVVAAAVSTIEVKLTEQALANPTATPEPTATPQPSPTPLPPTPTLDPATATPAASATPQPAAVQAKALYASSYPDGKREYIPNETFGLALGFQNTGTSAWGPGLNVKLTGFEGEITVQTELSTDKGVQPGDKIEFDLWAFGSETLGPHTWYFQLYSAEGVAIPGGSIAFSYTSK